MACRLDNAIPSDKAAIRPAALVYRVARRLETYSFAAAPEQLALTEGLRAAIAIASVVALAVWLDRPILSWAAFGAFWTCLVDPGGPDRRRLATMGGFALTGTLISFIAASASAAGLMTGGAALFALVFLAGLLGLYGPATAQVGTLGSVVAVVAVAFPQPPQGALMQSATFLLGTIWAQLLCIGLWRIHPHAALRRSLDAVYLHLDDMLADLLSLDLRDATASDWERSRAGNRRTLRAAIERARSAILPHATGGERYRIELDTADRIFAALVAAGHDRAVRGAILSAEERRLLNRLARLLAEMRRQTLRPLPRPRMLALEASGLRRSACKTETVTGRTVCLAAQALIDQTQAWLDGSVSRAAGNEKPLGLIRPIAAAILHHAARLAIAVTASYAVTALLGISFSYWAMISTVVVVQPLAMATWQRGLERCLGSIAGGFLAALLVLLAPTPLALLPAIFPVAAAAIALKRVNYTLFVIAVTCLFVLVAELLLPAAGLPSIRAVNSVIGSLIGAAALFLWPERNRSDLAAQLAAAIAANTALAVRAQAADIDPAAFDSARREAGLASTAAETACHRLALAGQSRRLHLREAAYLLAALRCLAGAALARALAGGAGADGEIRTALEKVAEADAAYEAASHRPP